MHLSFCTTRPYARTWNRLARVLSALQCVVGLSSQVTKGTTTNHTFLQPESYSRILLKTLVAVGVLCLAVQYTIAEHPRVLVHAVCHPFCRAHGALRRVGWPNEAESARHWTKGRRDIVDSAR